MTPEPYSEVVCNLVFILILGLTLLVAYRFIVVAERNSRKRDYEDEIVTTNGKPHVVKKH